MNEFDTKSKLYIAPKKQSFLFLTVLNICIVIAAILSLLSILGDGIKIENLSSIIIGIFVVIRSRTWLKAEPYYEFSIAHITLNENIFISYDTGRHVVIFTESICSIEYSDQLECLRFVADYDIEVNGETIHYTQEEFLFYIVEKDNTNFFRELAQHCGKQIIYVDRSIC